MKKTLKLLNLAYKNLARRKVRSLLTIGGVAVAVAVLVSLLGFNKGYENSLNNDIDKMGFQVLVTAKGCPYEAATLLLKGGGGLRYIEEDVYETISADPDVEAITPQLIQVAFDPDKNNGNGGFNFYMGVEDSLLELKPWLTFKSGGWFSGLESNEMIMGYEAAELEQRKVGDKMLIPGVTETFTVVGIFERVGTQDDGTIYMPMNTVQRIFEQPNKLSGVGIKLKDVSKIPAFEERMYDLPGTQVISMTQVKGTIMNLVDSARVMVTLVAVIAILVAFIGVVNTVLMSVLERTQELGIIRAMGAGRFDVFKLIWFETVIVCGVGGIVGGLVAVGGSRLVEMLVRKVVSYAPSGSLVEITPELFVIAFVGALVLGILAGLYPAARAAAMRPIDAIRSEE
ncbi:MAG: ABC transporter permease [bacterium]|nr:ABC transporter permease [bacterium]